jgi:hypothetical protein
MKPRRIPWLAYTLAALTLVSPIRTVMGESGMGAACPDSGVKIYLHQDGRVTLNGSTIDAANLSAALAKLQPRPTVVCYSRDNPEGEPPPQMQQVLEAIMALRLPIGIFTDRTFKTPVPMK